MRKAIGRRERQGLFVTFEGPEGSGKSTHMVHLGSTLREAGYSVLQTREPGGTKLAEAIRETLLASTPKEPVRPETEALLVLAARSQHVAHVIRPALARGCIVLCDRFADSTFAYQGFGRGLSLSWLRTANRAATGGLTPDLTVLLDVPASVGLARRRRARGNQNRLDRESASFHGRVREGYLRLAARTPRRMKIVNANRPLEVVRAEITSLVLGWLRTRERRAGAR